MTKELKKKGYILIAELVAVKAAKIVLLPTKIVAGAAEAVSRLAYAPLNACQAYLSIKSMEWNIEVEKEDQESFEKLYGGKAES